MLYLIPPEAKEKHTDIIIPLTDGEKVDQYEAELQMHPFIPESQQTAPSSTRKKPLPNKEEDTSSESNEEDTTWMSSSKASQNSTLIILG